MSSDVIAVPPTILVTGRNGQVGSELCRVLQPLGRVVAVGSAELDLSDGAALRDYLRDLRPDVIINAAAYTAVDKAESEPELAHSVNALAPGIMAAEAAATGALMLHYSTDYVFDGTGNRPYVETDTPLPCGVYGQTKLAGEQAVVTAGGAHLVLRTSWVYGARGANFMLTMLRLAAQLEELKVVDDQIGAPTCSRSIAATTAMLLARYLSPLRDGMLDDLNGVYHLGSAGQTSWFGFARHIIDGARERGHKQTLQRLLPITTAEYPTPAQRPAYSLLSSQRLYDRFGLALPEWQDDLDRVLDEWVR